ncbi:hypothetical protein Tco_0654892 [Tanacetum coccineum]|uniref:Uncharacterized protein n=1 Tax=Tanacetum coccineum TaxID=301880 RepID=A0ABQ4X4Y6_9ASTR
MIGVSLGEKRECQVKKEFMKTRHPQLHYESKIYRLLQAGKNGTSDEFNNKIVSKWNGRKLLQGNTIGTIKGGARIVISHPKGREMLKQQKATYPNVVVADSPDKMTLESVASDHSFTITKFINEPDLAVLAYQV